MDNQYPKWWNETEEELMQKTLNEMDKKWDKREGGFIFDSLAAYVKIRAIGREELKETFHMYFVMNATGEILESIVASRSPLTRFLAKYASGIVKVTGNPKTLLPADTRYMSVVYNDAQEPIEFVQLEDVTIGYDGFSYVNVKCLTIGEVGNIPAGAIEIASPIIGVASVINEQGFNNGAEREDDDSFRDRYLRWLKESGSSGNVSDYIRWSLEVSNVGSVVVLPIWAGRGTVKLLLTDGDFKPANQTIIDDAKDYICPVEEEGRGKAPIGSTVTIEPAEIIEVRLSATVVLKEGTNITDTQNAFQSSVDNYLLELNKTGWSPSIFPKSYVLNYLKVGALLVETSGILSVSNLTMNSLTDNLEAKPGQVFVLKEVILNE